MATVSDIVEKRGIVEIQADGTLIARVRKAHFAKCPLAVGEEIDPQAYLDRVAAAQFSDAYEAALTCLDYCARSAKELRSALSRRGYVDGAIEATVARLTESGLIDDARYAQRMAETQSRKPVGVYAFKRKLKSKGISDEDAEEALAAFDDAQQQAAARAAAEKLYRKYAELPEREARAKLGQALARRGFSWDAIEGAVDELF